LQLETTPEPTRPRSPLRTLRERDWVFALSLAFAVGVVVWFGRSVQDFFGGNVADVLVPSVIGQTLTDARAEAARLNLATDVIANRTSEQYPKDVVMGQQPPAGTHVREGRRLSLVVSTGVTIFPMPDLRYQSLREANLNLGQRKLALAHTTVVADEDVPAMHVLAQNPPPLASVHEGVAVTLTLSKGPPAGIRVPSLVGMFVDDARDEAARTHLHLGQVVWTPFGHSGPARGIVVRQKPDPGSFIDPFEPVSLQVSAGPDQYGYLVRQVHATTTIPLTEDTASVRIQVRDETGTWNVYNAYAQGGQKLDFNLTVIGAAELDTYVNNELLNQSTLGVEPPTPQPSPTPSPARR
jgi:eukaryotic-like serine/threonine-protein kinase